MKVKLTTEELKEIRTASENAEIVGLRYPEAAVQYLFGDTPPLTA